MTTSFTSAKSSCDASSNTKPRDTMSGPDDHLARGLLDAEDHDHHAVMGQLHPVPEHDRVHARVHRGARGLAVDVHPADVHHARALRAVFA